MFLLNNLKADQLKVPVLALPKGMVFALRAVGSHIQNVETSLMKEPKDLVKKILKEKLKILKVEHPELAEFFHHHEEDLIKEGHIRISVGIFNTFQSIKLTQKYYNAGIPANSVVADVESVISSRSFDIYDGVTTIDNFNYIKSMTKKFSYLPLSAAIVKEHENNKEKKIGALVKAILSHGGKFSDKEIRQYYTEEDLEELTKLSLTPQRFAVEQHSYVIGEEK